jgi:hypothetical protein
LAGWSRCLFLRRLRRLEWYAGDFMPGGSAMKWGCGSIGLVLAAGSFVVWNLFIQPSYEHRFRITIAVATPEGQKQGSSVWSITCSEPLPGGLSSMTGGCSMAGEAVFVDLGGGRNLIGLVARGPRGEGVDVYDISARAFDYANIPRNGNGDLRDSWYSYAPSWRGSRELVGNNIPTLISFADLNDPASARAVEPADFGFVFGVGYRMQHITLEIVPTGIWPLNLVGLWGTPVTRGIESKIPFLTAYRAQLRHVMRDMPPRFQTELWQFIRD